MQYGQLIRKQKQVYYGHSRTELKPFIPGGIKTVLDIGCSNGALGAMLKRAFMPGVGIEPDKLATQEAEKVLDRVINDLL